MILALDRRWLISIAAAGAFAVALPAWLLWPTQITIDRPPPLRPSLLRSTTAPLLIEALARPLFSPDRAPPKPVVAADTVAPEAEATPPQPPPELVGTIAGRRMSVALLRIASGETARAHVGEQVDGWTVVAIGDRQVVVAQGGRHETLRLSFKNERSGAGDGAGAAPPVIPPPPPRVDDPTSPSKAPQ